MAAQGWMMWAGGGVIGRPAGLSEPEERGLMEPIVSQGLWSFARVLSCIGVPGALNGQGPVRSERAGSPFAVNSAPLALVLRRRAHQGAPGRARAGSLRMGPGGPSLAQGGQLPGYPPAGDWSRCVRLRRIT